MEDPPKTRPQGKRGYRFPKGNRAWGNRKGSNDRTPNEIRAMIEAHGGTDPLQILSEFASSNLVDPQLRIQAAANLAPYVYGKRPVVRWANGIKGLEPPRTIAEACAYIAKLSALVAAGQVDVDAGTAVITMLQAYVDAKSNTELEQTVEDLGRLVQEILARGLTAQVSVSGGLGVMPGCENVLMPPRIEGKAHVWAAPDTASLVEAVPRRQKRPMEPLKPESGPDASPDDPKPPEGS